MSEEAGQEERLYLSAALKKTLELDGSPVAVAIVPEPPENLKLWRRKATPCMMIQSARRGVAFYCHGANIICGGRAHLGLGKPPVRSLEDFLFRREKLVGSEAAARRMLDLTKARTPDSGEYLVFAPLEKAEFSPDVVLFIGIPLQISRILFLDAFETGEINAVYGEPLCSAVIAAPITSEKIGVSFLDMACRSFGRYRPEEMAIGVPYARLPRIVNSINLSSAGTAQPNFLLKILPKLLNIKKSGTT